MPCTHTKTLRRPSRNLELHPGINFSKLEVGGDIGGLVFAAGSVIAVLIGLPCDLRSGPGRAALRWHEIRR